MMKTGSLHECVVIVTKGASYSLIVLNKYMLGCLYKHMIETAIIKYIILPCMKQGN